MPASRLLWGVDLGGTKIEGTILDASENFKSLARIRIDTEAQGGYRHILGRVATLVDRLAAETGLPRPQSLGIGTPGTLDPGRGTLKNSSTGCLMGHPILHDLETGLGCKVVAANDANCFAIAESRLGCAKNFGSVFGVILGTGVGGAIVVNGRLVEGRHGIAGEWGHNVLEENGEPCYCGKRGCVETVLCGPALERYYARLAGAPLPLREITTRARATADPHATATITRLVASFGKAISFVINILDPDAIVIGGGVGNIPALYGPETRAAIEQHLFNDKLETAILKPALGDSAGVLGAAMLVA